MSASKHALLGLLLDQPGYSYQLSDRLQQRLGPAWKVNRGQVHHEIKAMETEGLVERIESIPGARGDRHVFAITEEGATEFERWFDETPMKAVRLSRRPVLVKITFAGPRRLQEAMAQVDAYERGCAGQLNEIVSLREALPAEGPLVRADHLLLRLSLSADIFQMEGELRWCRHAREMLSWLANREAVWPSDRERSGAAKEQRDRAGARKELFTRLAAEEPEV
jgi:DNA-binding PadR family transcriptional regulator